MQVRPIKILISESGGFSAAATEQLSLAGELVLADLERTGLLSAIKDVDVLWVRLRHRIDAEIMAAAPQLKVIVTPTTGLNHIDLEEADRRGLQILSLRGETDFLQNVRATAELTLTLILALLRQLPRAVEHVLDGGWNRDLFRGHELYEKTIGIIGYGRLGRTVARYLKAFETRVLVSDPHVESASLDSEVKLVPLTRLLKEADLVTLHVDLNRETRSFFGAEQFSAMKKGACLVNTSRGELIDEKALLEALKSGRLGGAALDVLVDESSEGMKDHPLVVYAREHDNVLITPHIGGCTEESMEKTEMFLAAKLFGYLLAPDSSCHGQSASYKDARST